ncbi:hypothetical protein OsI_25707 [Oryza sativa Indica Group]|uniref:Uncharacterized protein n=1 Tax=Oryza sativa subsp. indica TaxID=39946 RepID=B8B598_ORYSI|nr:hypothetical protein OsI_25707 [Oryza sativa Indica Group]
MGAITSAELNFLIFRYLQESGFIHAAFTLGYEAGIHKGGIDGNLVPPGALITIVQKGLQYIELEANTDENDEDLAKDFALLEPLEIITKNVEELQQIVKKRKREKTQSDRDKDKGKEKERMEEHERRPGGERERERHDQEKELEKEKDRAERDRDQDKEKEKLHTERIDKVKAEEDSLAGGGPTPMDVSTTAHEISSADVTVLEGHSSEVFACAWSPAGSLLASGWGGFHAGFSWKPNVSKRVQFPCMSGWSGDSTARIWTIPDGPCGSITQSSPPGVHVLKHFKGRTNEKSKDVTTLDWNGEGTLLATGSYDGQARIWNSDGELKQTLFKHKGPIFSLKWNKKGDFLLSGSVDKTAIVWDTKTWECKQQFEFHSAPTLDVDWRNNNSFATCSTDNMIYVCKIGDQRPVKSFSGHQSEVNAIKWDPTGSLLASCSDDWTAKKPPLPNNRFWNPGPLDKLQDTMVDVLASISLLASKIDMVDLSRSVAVATSRITALEQFQVASSTSTSNNAPWLPTRQPTPATIELWRTAGLQHGDDGGNVPRFYKLEFPKFDGKDDSLKTIASSSSRAKRPTTVTVSGWQLTISSVRRKTGTSTTSSSRDRRIGTRSRSSVMVNSVLPYAIILSGLRFVVANGDRLVSPGLCRNLTLNIDDEAFSVDCFALDLCAVDIILGMQWLQTLGPILWDFKNMRMAIWRSTRKIWSMKQDKCVYDFKEHTKEIYTIRWSPTGPGTNNPNQQLLLASASFDSTIKLWEVEQGRLLYSLAGHRQPVYSVAFSPGGEYLASGSLDQCLHIWSVKEGRILKTYRGSGGIFEVCWNKEGSKIAACFSNNTVCLMDFRM